MQIKYLLKSKYIIHFFLSYLIAITAVSSGNQQPVKLDVKFDGGYGQIEVGSKFAGIEFHKSRPLPSRISFYYPVANSIDLSTDYWKRYESLPLNFLLTSNGQTDSLGKIPYSYSYTPYHAEFSNVESNFDIQFSYDFCEDLPVAVLKIIIQNTSNKSSEIELQSNLIPALHTSHTYAALNPAKVWYEDNSSIAKASFEEKAADSSLIFIANSGFKPVKNNNDAVTKNLDFTYRKNLAPNEQLEIIQLIGMCRIKEQETLIARVKREWQTSVKKLEERVLNYTYEKAYFNINDPDIMQTVHWSKAVIATNKHYLDGQIVPMPCPAEYNFFFTHDLLLTGLGAVNYDPDYVKNGFVYLKSLTGPDSILAHARYWKDDHYQIEYCNSDNWNHLWFIISASSYLKHSADIETIKDILPILKKSLQMMLQNKGENGLMYAKRPDWWDIGNIYGARAYISILMYKVLRDYVYIAEQLDIESSRLSGYLELSEKIKNTLAEKLWDDEAGYLLNMIDDKTIDKHYYAGSILAVHYNLLEQEKKDRLLETVRKQLLDENIGVRNAMPNDFHTLSSLYKFNGPEVGAPFVYFNGGVWPHNNIWYILALISNNDVEDAKTAVKKYMTLNGIKNSPNGVPSFYEYRMTDPNSERYGEIDKPTFLWAGGFFLQAIYQLSGMRENSFNISFCPNLPDGFSNTEYDLALFGKLCRVKWQGRGKFFRKIIIDGSEQNSAVVTSPAEHIILERGIPQKPYLYKADCTINDVQFDDLTNTLSADFSGQIKQLIHLEIVSPQKLSDARINNISSPDFVNMQETGGVYTYSIDFELSTVQNKFSMIF